MRPFLLSVAALLPLAAPAEARPTAAGARAFLERLYAPYRGQAAQPVTLEKPASFYEARLARAMIAHFKDAKRRDEAPELNGDPICDCQDHEPFTARIAPIRLNGNRASTVVTFVNGRPQRLDIELIATRAGWRIYDIRTGGHGLRSLLKL